MPLTISVNAGPDAQSSTVTVSGTDLHIITDGERAAFNIEDASLKSAVAAYFGEAPDDAFLCSPTPWGDLYQTYGWQQVQTTLAVQSATILGVSGNPAILSSQIFKNDSSIPADFNTGITQEVAVGTESNWTNSSALEVGQTISYEIGFLGSGAGGETSMSFTETWEEGGSESETVTLGTSSGVVVTLQPGQAVEAELEASKGVLQVQIVYQLTLAGVTAINYGDTYKDHHFWGLDINAVMQAGGLPTSIVTTETLSVDFYANSQIILKDPSGNVVNTLVMGAAAGK
jgi:hypothetical protein